LLSVTTMKTEMSLPRLHPLLFLLFKLQTLNLLLLDKLKLSMEELLSKQLKRMDGWQILPLGTNIKILMTLNAKMELVIMLEIFTICLLIMTQ